MALVYILNPLDAFSYSFFVRGFVVLILLSLILPVIGIRLAGKGFSMISDTLSHTSLAGIALGLVIGILPVWTSIIFSLISAFLIEIIRRKLPKHQDLALTIILAFSLGLVGILSQFAPSSNFESYLFGSPFSLKTTDLIILSVVVVVGLIYEVLFYRSNMALSYDENECKANKMPVIFLSFLDTAVTSIIIAVASNMIGSLLVASFISIPVAAGLKISHSSKGSHLASVIISLISSIIGLFIAYTFSLHVGGIIVMTNILGLIICFITSSIKAKKCN
jgi:zinc transport system permease protein